MVRSGFWLWGRLFAQGEAPPQPPVALSELFGEGEDYDRVHQGQGEGEQLSGKGEKKGRRGDGLSSIKFLLCYVTLPKPDHPLWKPENNHSHSQAKEHQSELPGSDLGAQVLSLAGASLALAVSLPEINQSKAQWCTVDPQGVRFDVHGHEIPGYRRNYHHAHQPVDLSLQPSEQPVRDGDGAGRQPNEEEYHQDGAQVDAHLLGRVGHVAVTGFGHDSHCKALRCHAGVEEPVGRLADHPAQIPARFGIRGSPERHRKCQQQPVSKYQVEDEGVDERKFAPVSVGEQDDHRRKVASHTQDTDDSQDCRHQDPQLTRV